MPSKYQLHKAKWEDCQRCSLCRTRGRVVFARGVIPAQVVFIGEAPGASEDVLGKPFVGPAGHLLDLIINGASTENTFSYCLTNLVCCIPKDEEESKLGEPPEEAIKACSKRLTEFVRLCKPSLIVRVGKLSSKWVPVITCEQVDIIHPAAILRMDVSQQGLAMQRCIVALRDAVEEL